MKLLILGGTAFLGFHLAHSAVRAGHEVTIFNRGVTPAEGLPESVRRLTGDRDGRLEALYGGKWDAVIDTSGYVPRVVRQSAELLAGAADHYTFISSISVYSDLDRPGVREDGPVLTLEDPSSEDVSAHYGALKALCEQEIVAVFPDRSLIIRPGLIVGPRDPSGRFTYWPSRLKRGGEVLAPGPSDAQVQFIDARDLADWTIRMVEERRTGTYNASGPGDILTMGRLLEACKQTLNPDAELVWVDPDFLLEHQVGPWMEMPLWIPAVGPTAPAAYLMAADVGKAVAAGLRFRPMAETIRDTAEWVASRPPGTPSKAGMNETREKELLSLWRNRP